MHIVLLSGGSGKRLWPLSGDARPKQFIPIFQTADGTPESMLQRVWRQLRAAYPDVGLTVAAAKAQLEAIHEQLSEETDVCVEPCRRDTFPAVALAAAYLHDIRKLPPEEAVVICPVDTFAEDGYFDRLQTLYTLARSGAASLVLMGVEPTYPSEKYGYILPESSETVSAVCRFKEKPGAEAAAACIRQGGLWNGGVFACKLGYLLQKAQEKFGCADYEALLRNYESFDRISFDYAVTEQEPDMLVLRYKGAWKDLGTWNTLTETMDTACIGRAVLDEACENTHVVNTLDLPVLCMGLKNTVVAVTAAGILVSDKGRSSCIKPYVGQLASARDDLRVLDETAAGRTVKVTLCPGRHFICSADSSCTVVWTVLSGTGRAEGDGSMYRLKPGDTLRTPAHSRWALSADTELTLIGVQLSQS